MTPLLIPDALWERLLDEFARHDPAVERVGFLDGIRIPAAEHGFGDAGNRGETATGWGAPIAVATTLVLPRAQLTPGWYRIGAAAMSAAGAHLRTFGPARLAQVHTHGNADTRHSPMDDSRAYSQRPGALSIVLPHHAQHRPAPSQGGVHVREVDGWRRVPPATAGRLIRLVPTILDQREVSCLTTDLPAPSPIDTCGRPAGSTSTRRRRLWSTWSFRRPSRT